jgi:hypothetical protein
MRTVTLVCLFCKNKSKIARDIRLRQLQKVTAVRIMMFYAVAGWQRRNYIWIAHSFNKLTQKTLDLFLLAQKAGTISPWSFVES